MKRHSRRKPAGGTEPVWIEEGDALAIHARLIELHGGAAGLRGQALLASALARPRQHHAYGSADLIKLSALYTVAIVRNHPFADGNKRTGFVVGVLFLELNGFEFHASEEEATQAVLRLAAGNLTEEEYAIWVGKNSKSLR